MSIETYTSARDLPKFLAAYVGLRGASSSLQSEDCICRKTIAIVDPTNVTGTATMKIVTSLSFRGQCAEAFGFYAEVLGGKITAAIPYGDAPPGMPISDPKYKSWMMHCWLEVGDQAMMGADMDLGWAPNIDKPKNGFDVTLHSTSIEEARRWFDQLSAGGKVSMPFGETFWSPGFGGLIDKFGVPWMINTIPQEGWKRKG